MTTRKLIVEVVEARSLTPKDGEGSSSPYVMVDFAGQCKRTKTKHKDLNPVWNEKLEFDVPDPSTMIGEELEAVVYNDKKITTGRRNYFLGRVKLLGSQFPKMGEETLVHHSLQNKSIFTTIKGTLGLKIYYIDEPIKPPDPPPENQPPPEAPPAETPQAEAPPAETPPAEAPQAEAPPAETPPAEASPPPEETPPAEAPPAEAPPAEAPAAEAPPAEAPPAESPPAEAPPAESPPAEAPPPAETSPAEAPPATEASAPAEDKPTEEAKAPEEVNSSPKEETTHRQQRPTMAPASTMSADYFTKEISSIGGNHERSAYDLVEKMPYLFVRIVKARSLPSRDSTGNAGDAFVKIRVGGELVRSPKAKNTSFSEWNQIFAFGKDAFQSAPTLEISVWDADSCTKDDFLGGVCFDLSEVPTRVPPDSPLAPQWYRLEGEGRVNGDIMLAVWMGTQADETFPEAWQSDTGGVMNTRSKVYLSPKLWYLRVNVIEAQDLEIPEKMKSPELKVRIQLGMQVLRTRTSNIRTSSPFWNEDLMFVAAEPFEEPLILLVEDRPSTGSNKDVVALGQALVPLTLIERRVDDRLVSSRWFNLEKPNAEPNNKYHGRIHLRMCFDGGYHVMDEAAHLSSDLRPTARQLWKSSIGVLELGILGAQNMLPMKTKGGRSTTDAYCVAKYGQKWIRTRTITDSFNPRWNEQYTWEVYDPCTVLTLGVFDNWHIYMNSIDQKSSEIRDVRIGKVRIRISTLESNRVYTNSYPLLVLLPSGVKKMGEIDIAVRFSCPSLLDVVQIYNKPLLPKMHYLHPLALSQQDMLRSTAMRIVALRLSRAEPPLRQEVVQYMLDADSNMWSMRRSKANWFRIMSVLSGIVSVAKWVDDICQWKNSITTVLVHFLFLILVWYPELIVPTAFFYVFLIGAWYYRFRPRMPAHMDTRISHADIVDQDELDEEFDPIQSTKASETVRMRYDRLRSLAARIQTVLGDFATQGERIQALLSWRDSRSTGIFIAICFIISLILYIVHIKMVLIILAFYFLRHPRFRESMPASLLNFFRRLPALSDRIM